MPLLKREAEVWPPDLFASTDPRAFENNSRASNGASRWWVAHTRSRQEKVLARHLLQWEVPFYMPQREHRFRAGDRVRTSHLPLFTGYVFFRGDLQERATALRSNVIANVIDVEDQLRLNTELRSLWLLQTTGEPLVPHPYLTVGDEVEITEGALRGYKGRVLREKGRYRLVVSITLLRQSVSIEIDREALQPAPARPHASRAAVTPHGAATRRAASQP